MIAADGSLWRTGAPIATIGPRLNGGLGWLEWNVKTRATLPLDAMRGPVHHRKQTSHRGIQRSDWCHEGTDARQQTASLFNYLVGARQFLFWQASFAT